MRALVLLAAALLPNVALAQAAGAPPSPITGLMPLVFIFIIFYFLLIRPQQKRLKQHETMTKELKKGDTVLTGGGIVGRIVKLDDDAIITVEIASGVEVRVARSTITSLLDKNGKPLAPEKGAGKNDNVKASTKNVANDN